MLTTLILFCSLALAPEARLCDRSNAIAVLELPERTALPMMCLMLGEEFAASTEFGKTMHPGDYTKVMCIKSDQGNIG